ncbi:hypothetical protein HMI01_18740 [Halolactibacillus miurensis]|uniref:Uncharacterized membrane protein YesL n=2 Tax=Halolactibacillus TaxID=306539 RepID=A0A1I6U0X0_9BACI|nr:DUF624 domain-containing protein [Halolactibacillus miurensis]GEM04886.1 hypothetical protein HMI01_18740 [Halolactibacillus miurensis]SFS95008.1 Uncharacterized membrane protein YesL [Halolactibacillus miurensis]
MNQNIMDRLIYQIANYVYCFFITNVYFMVLISPFIFVYYFSEFTIKNIFLYYVSLLLFGPAFAGLLKTMDKLIEDKIIAPTKTFWHYFRVNFKTAMSYWLIISTLLLILIVDLYYANLFAPFLSMVFLILMVGVIVIAMYGFPILTRFESGLKSLFVVSTYAVFRFFKVTVLNATTLISFGIIFYYMPGILSLFLMSFIAFFMMYNLKQPFIILQDSFQKDQGKEK